MGGAVSRPLQHSQIERWPRSKKEQWLWEGRTGIKQCRSKMSSPAGSGREKG